MRPNVNRAAPGHFHRPQKCAVIVAAVYAAERVVINGFDAELQRYVSPLGKLADHADLFFVHAIGPGAYGEADDLRVIDCVPIKPTQKVYFRVCIEERMKIDDEFLRIESLSDVLNAFADLIA